MNKKPKIVAIIPSRMAASRLPGKPLKMIHGLPMIEHVRRRTLLAQGIDEVYVATCDLEVKKAVEEFGGKVIMTKDTHIRPTDRVEEAAGHIKADIIIMAQGDEPLLIPQTLSDVVNPLLENKNLVASNIIHPMDKSDLSNKNVVKVVLSNSHKLLYLSRSAIPGIMSEEHVTYYKQSGIMAFTKDFLHTYAELTPTPHEKQESIDMLRVLVHDYKLQGVVNTHETRGVDTPSDIEFVEKMMMTDPIQKDLYNKTK